MGLSRFSLKVPKFSLRSIGTRVGSRVRSLIQRQFEGLSAKRFRLSRLLRPVIQCSDFRVKEKGKVSRYESRGFLVRLIGRESQ